jgi:hypothetical protein
MKNMVSGGLKGISGAVIVFLTYINNTFTPLFWVLLVLVALDLLLNAHKEGQQFIKIGSMALTLGAPGYVAANLSNPNLGKYLVAIMCIVYLQLVVPQIVAKLASMKLSKDPVQNQVDQAALQAALARLADFEKAQAQKALIGAQPQAPQAPTNPNDAQG